MCSQILVIEDDRAVRELMLHTLSKAGYRVLSAEDGNEGMNIFRTEHPDLVITDIVMPQKEGFETIMALRKEQPDVKVIAMSGGGRHGTEDYLSVARKLGACRTVAKPFLRDEMLRVVREALQDEAA